MLCREAQREMGVGWTCLRITEEASVEEEQQEGREVEDSKWPDCVGPRGSKDLGFHTG